MGLFRGTKNVVKKNINVSQWIGFRMISQSANSLVGIVKHLFIPAKAKRVESFAEAIQRLNLSEKDIQLRQMEFFRLAIIFLVVGTLIFFYMVWLAWSNSPIAAVLAFIVSLITFIQGYRYHFWYFQTKHRKLGCSFREWLHSEVDNEQGKTNDK